MLSAQVAIPLIVTTECLLLRVASEAGAKVQLVATELFKSLTSTTPSGIPCFKFAGAETFVLDFL